MSFREALAYSPTGAESLAGDDALRTDSGEGRAFAEEAAELTSNLLTGGRNPLDTSVGRADASATLPQLLRVSNERSGVVDILAEWNGCVTSVRSADKFFLATLTGVIGEGVRGQEEDASIPMADVSEWDRDLLRPGNFFRLCVIHEVLPSGQPRRYTQVVFRRLPAYRQHDLDRAAERGRELAWGLRVE